MMKTLIAATDFSPLAENAVNYAAALAKHDHAGLVLFNAFTVPVAAANGMLSTGDFDDLLLDNQKRLKERAEQLAHSYGIEVQYESTYSRIPEELEALLAQYEADLVVLGMEPASFTQDLFGNTTTALIRQLNCPVLAVPESAHFEGLKKIIFACDLAHELPSGILQRVKAMAIAFGAEVEVFFVQEAAADEATVNDTLAAGLEGITYSCKKIQSDAVVPAIRQELTATGADLLIMAPKVYGFWPSVVHRSKTRKLAAGLSVPLLAIHD